MTIKKYFFILSLMITALTIQLNTDSRAIGNQVEALFLGCGIKDTPGPCNDAGFRVVRHQVKVFGLDAGDSWTTNENCDARSGVGRPNL